MVDWSRDKKPGEVSVLKAPRASCYGKQVFYDGKPIADAVSESAALFIVRALEKL